MPRVLPRFCEKFRDRHGRLRIYFRRGKGARIALPNDPASEAFARAYAAALVGDIPAKSNAPRVAEGTLGSLLCSYKASLAYKQIRATTKAAYSTPLRRLEEEHGHRTLTAMTRERIMRKVLEPLADRPGAYHITLKVLRIVINHGLNLGVLKDDPTRGIKRPRLGEIRSWSDEEIAAFHASWPRGTMQRLAFDLHLYTGQRRSDVHRMTWADIKGDAIAVVQQKTKAKLLVAMHPDLIATLSEADRNHVAIITTPAGKAYTVDSFSSFMRDAIKKAGQGLDCKPHGLRKAAGRRMAEAGCSAKEIMAILGHKSLAEAEHYVKEADQAGLARSAVSRMAGQTKNKVAQTTVFKFGKNSKNGAKSNG